jgi:glycosyltransferase involved in cell wall biosynthesis
MTPQVSVVIATRNRWPLLSTHALPSALGQEEVELEVIVVDDASTDDTEARLREVRDPRLRVIRNERNRKLPAARNTGAAAARGEWLAFLDDDDLWAPRKLRLQLNAAAEQRADWAYGAALVVDLERRVLGRDPLPEPAALAGLLQTGNYVPGGGSNVVVRAETVHRLGGFDEQLRFFEDWDLWLRLLAVGPPAVCRDVVMARVEHPGNMVLRDAHEVMPAFTRLISKHRPITIGDRLGVLQWLAYEHHRAGRRLGAAALFLRAAVTCRSPGNLPPAVGALFGERGMKIASRLLHRIGGRSHVDPDEQVPVPTPSWLAPRA